MLNAGEVEILEIVESSRVFHCKETHRNSLLRKLSKEVFMGDWEI